MDRLSEVLRRFSISAGVFYSGGLCGLTSFEESDSQEGHLHLLKRGRIEVFSGGKRFLEITEPALLFYPRPFPHRISADEEDKAEIVCASIDYGVDANNPLANALPDFIHLPLRENEMVNRTTGWLFDEAFSSKQGKSALMDRLCEILIIELLRLVIEKGEVKGGVLAGLSHPNVSRALIAIHDNPARPWNLEALADVALLSRSKFAEVFKEVVNQTPADYVSEWRIGIAQTLLKKGKPVSLVANAVGYEDSSALARVFRKKTGTSPKAWQKNVVGPW